MPAHLCQFYTNEFRRCSRRESDGTPYCRTHQPKAAALGERPAGCPCTRRRQNHIQWCGGEVPEGQEICAYHHDRVQVRIEQNQHHLTREQRMRDQLHQYLNERPVRTWQQVTADILARTTLPRDAPRFINHREAFTVARRFFLRMAQDGTPLLVFVDAWLGRDPQPGNVAQAAPAVGRLGRLAMDTQNIHTVAVSNQTNENVELLLKEAPIPGMDTLTTLTMWWLVTSPKPAFDTYWRVMMDVRHWYGVHTCKSMDDRLYRRVMDGLVSKITRATDSSSPNDELFTELSKRLWEECEEAAGMCCEGHISRLANVMVGFDETFRPPVAIGEILQTKMAAIAEKGVSAADKISQAMDLMNELGIPDAERAPWLEALVE